jgi:hypothetical protein
VKIFNLATLAIAAFTSTAVLAAEPASGTRSSMSTKGGGFSNSIGGYNNGTYYAAGSYSSTTTTGNQTTVTSGTYFAVGKGDGSGGVYGYAKWTR